VRHINAELEQRVADRTAALEAANKELEAFSYSVSHDLRTPLRSIDGFSQALLEDYGDVLDKTGHDYLRRVRAAAQRMAELIDDMIMLARVTRSEMHRTTVDLSALAQSIAANLQAADPDRQGTWQIAENVTAEGDTRLLRVALENLLGNAWKFTGKQPTATITFGTTDRDGERVYFVRDDGAGFDMTYANKLFGAFQRLHDLNEFPGTGIGLATVARIIHRHGGRVWAEGAVGKGATFYFTLAAA
jgi:light-regulated signal transduction histidine kinase (bacteriophytochrome)